MTTKKRNKFPPEIREAQGYWTKIGTAKEGVLEQARFITKHIQHAHICVQLEPAIKKLCAEVIRLEKLEGIR